MIAIGSDHAAFHFKEAIKAWLLERRYAVKDFGTCGTQRVDYCDFGFRVGEAVASGACDKGLVFCGTGVGIAISANKVPGVRAVVCSEPYSAQLSREHNDTNVLALGSRVVGLGLAHTIIEAWLNARFEGGRHQDRLDKIAAYEAGTRYSAKT